LLRVEWWRGLGPGCPALPAAGSSFSFSTAAVNPGVVTTTRPAVIGRIAVGGRKALDPEFVVSELVFTSSAEKLGLGAKPFKPAREGGRGRVGLDPCPRPRADKGTGSVAPARWEVRAVICAPKAAVARGLGPAATIEVGEAPRNPMGEGDIARKEDGGRKPSWEAEAERARGAEAERADCEAVRPSRW